MIALAPGLNRARITAGQSIADQRKRKKEYKIHHRHCCGIVKLGQFESR